MGFSEMTEFLTGVDSTVAATALAILMIASWLAGHRFGPSPTEKDEHPEAKFTDASLAILGLLLAFTFSMALTKHDQRRAMLVTDCNAIGDFSTCVASLDESEREPLMALIRKYVDLRLNAANEAIDYAKLANVIKDSRDLHNEMQAIVVLAARKDAPAAVPLVNTFNDVTSAHAARYAALRDHLPGSIVVLLVVSALVSVFLVGSKERSLRRGAFGPTLCFVGLVSVCIGITLDLNEPQRGWIRVDQEPFRQLQMSLNGE